MFADSLSAEAVRKITWLASKWNTESHKLVELANTIPFDYLTRKCRLELAPLNNMNTLEKYVPSTEVNIYII